MPNNPNSNPSNNSNNNPTSANTADVNRPIVIFDSGVGGITIAKEIRQQLTSENLIYLADSAFSPYGDKSPTQIIERVNAIANWCQTLSAKSLVVACNTATVTAIDSLRAQYAMPIIGVEPAIKPAAKASLTKHIGILATQATASNPRFLALSTQHANNCQVHIQPCPGLVELIEQDQSESDACQTLLIQYLTPLLEHNIDHLVLGCTHYPILTEQINALLKEHKTINVELMETAKPVTQQLKQRLSDAQLLACNNQHPWQQFYTTAQLEQQDRQDLEQLMSKIFGHEIELETAQFKHSSLAL